MFLLNLAGTQDITVRAHTELTAVPPTETHSDPTGDLWLDKYRSSQELKAKTANLIWLLEQGSNTCDSEEWRIQEPAGCRAGVQLQLTLAQDLKKKKKTKPQRHPVIYQCGGVN